MKDRTRVPGGNAARPKAKKKLVVRRETLSDLDAETDRVRGGVSSAVSRKGLSAASTVEASFSRG